MYKKNHVIWQHVNNFLWDKQSSYLNVFKNEKDVCAGVESESSMAYFSFSFYICLKPQTILLTTKLLRTMRPFELLYLLQKYLGILLHRRPYHCFGDWAGPDHLGPPHWLWWFQSHHWPLKTWTSVRTGGSFVQMDNTKIQITWKERLYRYYPF